MNRLRGDWVLVILLVLYTDRHLCTAEHHPYCQTSCGGLRLKAARINCLLGCDQDLTGVFYRGGRGSFPYLSFVPATMTGDDDRDDLDGGLGDAFKVPVNDLLLREPRDRSAFVRIGKRDVSSVLNPAAAAASGGQKRRDEFVRIGKGGANQGNRSPFIVGRPYAVQGPASGARAADGYEEAKVIGGSSAADETLLLPIADAIKRKSAFVRIGKRRNDDVDRDNAGSLAGVYGNNVAPQDGRTHQKESRHGSEESLAGPDETGEMEKKASAFVRIGRKGAAFVRIGKYDPNNHMSEQ